MTTVAGKSKFVDQNTGQTGERVPLHLTSTFFGSDPLCAVKKYTEQTYFLVWYSVPKGEGQEHFPKKATIGKNATPQYEIEKRRTFSPELRQLHNCIPSIEGNVLPSLRQMEIVPKSLPLSSESNKNKL